MANGLDVLATGGVVRVGGEGYPDGTDAGLAARLWLANGDFLRDFGNKVTFGDDLRKPACHTLDVWLGNGAS